MKIVEEVRLFRSFFSVCLRCHRQSNNSTCSLKKLVVSVYKMGFKALLMGRMKMTTQLEIVPGISTSKSERTLTKNMGIQQRASENTMKKKPVSHSHVFVQSAPQVRGVDARFIDGVKHAGVAEEDDEESHQIKT